MHDAPDSDSAQYCSRRRLTVRYMRINLATALVAALLTTASIVASAQTMQPGPGWSMLKTYVSTIVRIDAAARTVTTRDAAGEVTTFEAPPSMPSSQLATFAPGDNVTVTFYDGFEVRRPGGVPLA